MSLPSDIRNGLEPSKPNKLHCADTDYRSLQFSVFYFSGTYQIIETVTMKLICSSILYDQSHAASSDLVIRRRYSDGHGDGNRGLDMPGSLYTSVYIRDHEVLRNGVLRSINGNSLGSPTDHDSAAYAEW